MSWMALRPGRTGIPTPPSVSVWIWAQSVLVGTGWLAVLRAHEVQA